MATIAPGDGGITIEGRIGTWYALYSYRSPEGRMYHVMESEVYGDSAEWLCVDEHGVQVTDDEIIVAISAEEYEEVV